MTQGHLFNNEINKVELRKPRKRWGKNTVQTARELVYKTLEAADHAEVNKQALMTEGNPLIPALLMAMTKGEAAAVPFCPLLLRPGSLDGTRTPITAVPRT
jgi:hypothetical protein